jgi:hypothetical protein
MEACAMSSTAAKEFETYARDCVKLAKQDNTPPDFVTDCSRWRASGPE